VPTTQAALEALKVLIEYTETGNSGIQDSSGYLRLFGRLERELKANEGIQTLLDQWFTGA
jgi:hypothetical protein